MSASPIASLTPSIPIQLQPESNRHQFLRDLTVALITLELVAECADLAADLRCLVEAAHRRLLNCAEQ